MNPPEITPVQIQELRDNVLAVPADEVESRIKSVCNELLSLRAQRNTLQSECERLKQVVDAAVTWRRYGYEGNHELFVGINPLLDAIDKYEGVERPTTEWNGENDL